MSGQSFTCSYSVRSVGNGFVGSYEIFDEAGEVVETWQGRSVFPTAAPALACAQSKAEAAREELREATLAPSLSY